MLLPKCYETICHDLYEKSNQVIRYRLDTEILQKERCRETYPYDENGDINYWMNVHEIDKIHGREDRCFENAISKLLDYGFTKINVQFHHKFQYILDDKYWSDENFLQIIVYPFLVRAGYLDNVNVNRFFHKRMDRIINSIEKYHYDFQDTKVINNQKYGNDFRFKTDCIDEPLPTIYDIYAFAYYSGTDAEIVNRIETIVAYVLHSKFQAIPDKAYIYDRLKKRYYAAGSIYHACLREERKLLNILLFSNFKAIQRYDSLLNEIESLLKTKNKHGFFCFSSALLKEQKDCYQLYSAAHMGLNENRNSQDRMEIESTFIMLKIISNLYKNGIFLEREA